MFKCIVCVCILNKDYPDQVYFGPDPTPSPLLLGMWCNGVRFDTNKLNID